MSAASRSGRYGLQRATASSPISATSRIFPVSRPRISSLVSEFNSSASRLYSSNSQRLPNSSSSLSVTNLIKRAKEPVSVLAVRLRPENGFIAATKTFVSTTKRLGTLSPSDPIIRLRLDPPCYFIHVFPLTLHSETVCDFLYVELLQYQAASVCPRHEKRAVLRKFHPIPDLLGNHHPPRLVYRRYGFHHSTINTIMALNKHIYCPVAFAEKGDANAFGVTAMEIIGLEIIGLEEDPSTRALGRALLTPLSWAMQARPRN